MTTLNYVYVKDVRPGDELPYMGDTVVSVEVLPNGNVGLHTAHSGVFYWQPYEQLQTVIREEVQEPEQDPEPSTEEDRL